MSTSVGGEPRATVLVPARNEVGDISECIEAIAQQDVPLDHLEVLVVDGGSVDGTAEAAEAALDRFGFRRALVMSNPTGTTPSNLNVGLGRARGRYLCRVDARSRIPTDYVRRCIGALEGHAERSVVGGGQEARVRTDRPAEIGIARALNNRWTMGLSKYRRGGSSGPTDTVYLGAFRTGELRTVGGWDEGLATNQDFDLNRRMGNLGQVWFLGGLSVGYLPRADHWALYRQYHRFGSWKVAYWRRTGDVPRPRQVVAMATVPMVALGIAGLARAPRRERIIAVGLVGAAAAMIEDQGSSGPHGGIAARTAAVAAMGCIWGGWTLGAWSAVIQGGRGEGLG